MLRANHARIRKRGSFLLLQRLQQNANSPLGGICRGPSLPTADIFVRLTFGPSPFSLCFIVYESPTDCGSFLHIVDDSPVHTLKVSGDALFCVRLRLFVVHLPYDLGNTHQEPNLLKNSRSQLFNSTVKGQYHGIRTPTRRKSACTTPARAVPAARCRCFST